MKKSEEEYRKERLELLKLKQGIIEQSELIPEKEEKEKPDALSGINGTVSVKNRSFFRKVGDFLYLNGIFVAIGVFIAGVAALLLYQILSQEKEDVRVIFVATEQRSSFVLAAKQLEYDMEQYIPDIDENGNIHADVSIVSLIGGEGSQEMRAGSDLLQILIRQGRCRLILADAGFYDYMKENYAPDDGDISFLFEKWDSADAIFDGFGFPLEKTALAKTTAVNLPENSAIFIQNKDFGENVSPFYENAKETAKCLIGP